MNALARWIQYERSMKKNHFSELEKLWLAAAAAQFDLYPNAVKKLSTNQTNQLKEIVNTKRKILSLPEHADIRTASFRKDLYTMIHSACINQAEQIYLKANPQSIKKQIFHWLSQKNILKLSETCFVIDESIDRLLGLNERKVKASLTSHKAKQLYDKEDLYLESPPEELFTPYWVILKLFKKLKPRAGSTWIDLGSGLGRVGMVLGIFYPKVNFVGYEIMKERHSQAKETSNRLKIANKIRFEQQDLSDSNFDLPLADCYFLFNPFNLRTLRFLLNKIRLSSRKSKKPLLILSVMIGRPHRVLPQQTFLKRKSSVLKAPSWEGKGIESFVTLN